MPIWPEYLDPEPPGPLQDEAVKVYCTNVAGGCPEAHERAEGALRAGDWWHPTVVTEYQGEYPQGGLVEFYTDDAFDCPGCGAEGKEIE